ncbi:MAG: hypothetical protein JG767_1754 [Deferribacteraceae bacterium]|jgi:hypothetical protein|nr:hypothetical protein [Deferribacteraceae bacterium]
MNYYFERIIIILFIFALPYNNFPFIQSGTLKPLVVLPILIYITFKIAQESMQPSTHHINKLDKQVLTMFIVFHFISLVMLGWNYEYMLAQKQTSPLVRYIQFFIYSFISLASYYIGSRAIRLIGLKSSLHYILLSFGPSLIIGVFQIITKNSRFINQIRSFFVSTQYPDGYYRIHLLTTEPSHAAIDLVVFIIPITLYCLQESKNKIGYGILLTIQLLLVFYTKSILGVILLFGLCSIVLVLNLKLKYFSRLFQGLIFIAFVGVILYFSGVTPISKNDIDYFTHRLTKSINNADESAITRTASYEVAYNIFREYPILGIGFRNAGYYYKDFINKQYLNIGLIRDWGQKDSPRFADIKSTFLEVLVASGIIGSLFFIKFYLKILSFIKKIKCASLVDSKLFLVIVGMSIVCSFSISLIGYPYFWFVIGIISGYYRKFRLETFNMA